MEFSSREKSYECDDTSYISTDFYIHEASML